MGKRDEVTADQLEHVESIGTIKKWLSASPQLSICHMDDSLLAENPIQAFRVLREIWAFYRYSQQTTSI
jgi:hypothetical protein